MLSMILLVLAVSGCGTENKETAASSAASDLPAAAASEEAAGKDAKDIKVAGIVPQEHQFMMLMQMGYQAAADDYGVECMLANSNSDETKEAELVTTYTSQGLDGIAISPLNEQTSIQTLKVANEKGLEISVGNTKLADAPFVCGGYTSDNYGLGEQTGKEARKFIEEELDGKAKIAVIQYKSLLPEQSADRVNGFLDQLEGLEVEIVSDQDAWMQDTAVQTAGDILTASEASGGVDIIFGANEGSVIGATMAAKNAGKAGKTFVFGIDAAEQQVDMLRADDNILQCVTGQNGYEIGYKTMEILIQTIRGEGGSYGKEIVVPGIVLSRDDPEGIDQFEKELTERMGK